MQHPEFFIRYEDIKDMTMEKFSEYLHCIKKKEVQLVTVGELCAMTEYPNGLYFFFDEDNLLQYVGKSSSRSFIERIPSHFDPRHDAWFNTLPKKIMQHAGFESYLAAHSRGLEMRVVMLGITTRRTVDKLENQLRSFLQPVLNSAKRGNVLSHALISNSEA